MELTVLESNESRFQAVFGQHRSSSLRYDGLRFPSEKELHAASWVALGNESTRLCYTETIIPDAPFLWVTQANPELTSARVSATDTIPYHSSVQDWLDDAADQLVLLAGAVGAVLRTPARLSGNDPERIVPSLSTSEWLHFHAEKGEYIRITSIEPDEELVYWDAEAFAVDPVGVCGDLIDALQSGANQLTLKRSRGARRR